MVRADPSPPMAVVAPRHRMRDRVGPDVGPETGLDHRAITTARAPLVEGIVTVHRGRHASPHFRTGRLKCSLN
jgi:hypothetical protein